MSDSNFYHQHSPLYRAMMSVSQWYMYSLITEKGFRKRILHLEYCSWHWPLQSVNIGISISVIAHNTK